MYFTILLCLKIYFKYCFLQDDIEIDLDEVLDMEDESERKTYISELLRVGCKRPLKVEHVNLFVGDLLEKVKTL